jgi:hypothetical protein
LQKENLEFERRKKKDETISRTCNPHHKRASPFNNTHNTAGLHFLSVIEILANDLGRAAWRTVQMQKRNPDFEKRKK